MKGGALIDGEHRYHLWRSWGGPENSVCFVMLNPSTADEYTDDPTIRKCIGFAQRWGFDSIDVVNLYSYRATDPRELQTTTANLNGALATSTILRVMSAHVKRVIFAWGTKGDPTRAGQIDRIARGHGFAPQCLKLTQGGHPQHPLYLPYTQRPIPFPEIHQTQEKTK